MKDSKKLLLAQLTDLHTTMLAVHERAQELNMSTWVAKLSGSRKNHYCACICGWQSLSSLENFPGALEGASSIAYRVDREVQLNGIAVRLGEDLEESVEDFFGSDHLANSIYEAEVKTRLLYAEASELFSEEELNHPHLNKEPTPLEAASFIALCIEKVNYDRN